MARNELKRHKKSDKIKWFITGILLVLVLVMLIGLCMQVFATNDKMKPSNWFKKAEQTDKLPDEGGEKKDGGETSQLEIVSAEGEIYVIS